MNERVAAAHEYVRNALGVMPLFGLTEAGACRCAAGATCPLKSRGKHPSLGRAWQERALTSGADVQAWYDEHPHDNVGILTGPESGIFVLDVDGAAGVASLAAMAAEHGAFPPTRIIRTGSGGLHYYYRHPDHFVVQNSTSYLAPGIDIRGKGGQVVAPPSVSARGAYDVLSDQPVGSAPDWLLAALAEHSGHVLRGSATEVRGAERVDMSGLPPELDLLRRTLVGIDQGRHKHFHAIVGACFDAGFTQGQAVTIAAPWCAEVGKFTNRVEQEVARSWAKLGDKKAAEQDWLREAAADSAGQSPRPDTPDAPGGLPGRS